MWNTETLLVVILRGVAHRLCHDNVNLRNINPYPDNVENMVSS